MVAVHERTIFWPALLLTTACLFILLPLSALGLKTIARAVINEGNYLSSFWKRRQVFLNTAFILSFLSLVIVIIPLDLFLNGLNLLNKKQFDDNHHQRKKINANGLLRTPYSSHSLMLGLYFILYVCYLYRSWLLLLKELNDLEIKKYVWKVELNNDYTNVFVWYRSSIPLMFKMIIYFSVWFIVICLGLFPFISCHLSHHYCYLSYPLLMTMLLIINVLLYITAKKIDDIFDVVDLKTEMRQLFQYSSPLFFLSTMIACMNDYLLVGFGTQQKYHRIWIVELCIFADDLVALITCSLVLFDQTYTILNRYAHFEGLSVLTRDLGLMNQRFAQSMGYGWSSRGRGTAASSRGGSASSAVSTLTTGPTGLAAIRKNGGWAIASQSQLSARHLSPEKLSAIANSSWVQGGLSKEDLKLHEVLGTKFGFVSFMNVVVRQQCLEVMLFLIETAQFKARVRMEIIECVRVLYEESPSVFSELSVLRKMVYPEEYSDSDEDDKQMTPHHRSAGGLTSGEDDDESNTIGSALSSNRSLKFLNIFSLDARDKKSSTKTGKRKNNRRGKRKRRRIRTDRDGGGSSVSHSGEVIQPPTMVSNASAEVSGVESSLNSPLRSSEPGRTVFLSPTPVGGDLAAVLSSEVTPRDHRVVTHQSSLDPFITPKKKNIPGIGIDQSPASVKSVPSTTATATITVANDSSKMTPDNGARVLPGYQRVFSQPQSGMTALNEDSEINVSVAGASQNTGDALTVPDSTRGMGISMSSGLFKELDDVVLGVASDEDLIDRHPIPPSEMPSLGSIIGRELKMALELIDKKKERQRQEMLRPKQLGVRGASGSCSAGSVPTETQISLALGSTDSNRELTPLLGHGLRGTTSSTTIVGNGGTPVLNPASGSSDTAGSVGKGLMMTGISSSTVALGKSAVLSNTDTDTAGETQIISDGPDCSSGSSDSNGGSSSSEENIEPHITDSESITDTDEEFISSNCLNEVLDGLHSPSQSIAGQSSSEGSDNPLKLTGSMRRKDSKKRSERAKRKIKQKMSKKKKKLPSEGGQSGSYQSVSSVHPLSDAAVKILELDKGIHSSIKKQGFETLDQVKHLDMAMGAASFGGVSAENCSDNDDSAEPVQMLDMSRQSDDHSSDPVASSAEYLRTSHRQPYSLLSTHSFTRGTASDTDASPIGMDSREVVGCSSFPSTDAWTSVSVGLEDSSPEGRTRMVTLDKLGNKAMYSSSIGSVSGAPLLRTRTEEEEEEERDLREPLEVADNFEAMMARKREKELKLAEEKPTETTGGISGMTKQSSGADITTDPLLAFAFDRGASPALEPIPSSSIPIMDDHRSSVTMEMDRTTSITVTSVKMSSENETVKIPLNASSVDFVKRSQMDEEAADDMALDMLHILSHGMDDSSKMGSSPITPVSLVDQVSDLPDVTGLSVDEHEHQNEESHVKGGILIGYGRSEIIMMENDENGSQMQIKLEEDLSPRDKQIPLNFSPGKSELKMVSASIEWDADCDDLGKSSPILDNVSPKSGSDESENGASLHPVRTVALVDQKSNTMTFGFGLVPRSKTVSMGHEFSQTMTMADLLSGRGRNQSSHRRGTVGSKNSRLSRTGLSMRSVLKRKRELKPDMLDPERIERVDFLPWDRKMRTFKLSYLATLLHDRFIEEQSPLAVNVSYRTRKEVYHEFRNLHLKDGHSALLDSGDNYDDESMDASEERMMEEDVVYDEDYLQVLVSMFSLFDQPIAEVYKLLETDTFVRFKTSAAYHRLRASMNPVSAQNAEQVLLVELNRELKILEKKVARQRTRALREAAQMYEY